MRLQAIKLAGFKSFVDSTTVSFPSNLCAVVGPNGCGKSNIIDAVRWVMGESSAKNLRGESMTDVIFNGASSRKPVGQASIELIFDNADGRVGGEFAAYSEVSVKRQVSRDGQSTYFLNKNRCRRKDITDLFLGTGLGPRSYSIIEQGMISQLIEARPEDLRIYIEEAAGISKYKERRRETERRISHTRDNLERLTDLREELERQLLHLERQAKAAERYKLLKQEEREQRAQLQVLRWRRIAGEAETQEMAVNRLTNDQEARIADERRVSADIEEQLSETPYMTQRAIDFMKHAGDQPWLCHLSYIKPHWPYIVPAPYHNMYSKEHIIPAVRSEQEKETNHPVYGAYLKSRICQTFARDDVRERVIPAYMGLIKQIDDQLGVLFTWMKEAKLFDNTMIVFTSDHGDYLGDHWMGEKDLFHDQSVKVPLIIYDPRKEAKVSEGRESNHLVECIDLAPTFLDFFNINDKPHILEGRGLKEILHSNEGPTNWREYAISEYDYSTRQARHIIGNKPDEAQLFMIRDSRWKYIFAEGFRPMLFDLEVDPKELHDLGESEQEIHLKAKKRLYDALFEWARKHHSRTTVTNEEIEKRTGKEPPGVIIGVWDEEEHQILFEENRKK